MSVEWKAFVKRPLEIGEDSVRVPLSNGRSQTVMIESHRSGMALRMWSIVLSKSKTEQLADGRPHEYAWERNRLSDLVGFTVDSRGRFIGESWVPLDGLRREVFLLHLEEVARVCDWHELRLSDGDQY